MWEGFKELEKWDLGVFSGVECNSGLVFSAVPVLGCFSLSRR